ncbi:MAG: Fe-S cluster assembly protein SufD [Deltaproteobacteria bacterium]|nr:Fe-S cluster assembly protein SufD [Deltaproteobacteria bacterium]
MNAMHLMAAELAGASGRAGEPDWLRERRGEGRARFEALGWPTRADEAWRYVKMRELVRWGEASAPPPDAAAVERAMARAGTALDGVAARVVMVDGVVRAEATTRDGSAPEVSVLPLGEALSVVGDHLRSSLGRIASLTGDGVAALALAELGDALVVHVPRGAALSGALEIVHVATGGEAGLRFPRVFVAVDATGELTLIERFIGVPEEAGFTAATTEILVGGDATVRHVRLVDLPEAALHNGHVGVRVGRGGSFTSYVLSLGGRLGRTELTVDLAEPGASCQLDGLYVASGDSHFDHATTIAHTSPHTTSGETYKGVIGDAATGTFFGRVLIREGAVKSDTRQLNHNLLLSTEARVHTRPQLEIDNDDVKAAHGSTVGQLDEMAVFYLRSRGIDERSARGLLTWAFAEEMVVRLPVPALVRELGRVLAARLASDASPVAAAAIEEAL